MVVEACNPRIQKAEAERRLPVQGQPVLRSSFLASESLSHKTNEQPSRYSQLSRSNKIPTPRRSHGLPLKRQTFRPCLSAFPICFPGFQPLLLVFRGFFLKAKTIVYLIFIYIFNIYLIFKLLSACVSM